MICKHASTMLNCFISTQHFNYWNFLNDMKKVLRTSRDTTKNAPCLRRSHTIRCSVRIYSAILRLFIYIYIQHVPKTQTSLCCPQTTTQGGSHSMTCTIPLTSLTNHTANIVYNLFKRVWENITHNPSLSLSILISLFLFSWQWEEYEYQIYSCLYPSNTYARPRPWDVI